MIKHELDGMTTLERLILLTRYLSHPVSVHTLSGQVLEGVLDQVTPTDIHLGSSLVPLTDLQTCVARIGGDWCSTNSHRPNTKVTRVQIRLRPHEKDSLKVAAIQQGKTLSEFILEAAIDRANL